MSNFKITHNSTKSKARAGILKTAHGQIETPFFMPIATVGAVKTLSTQDLKILGAGIILSNTYHLLLRPGMKLMKKSGGLHKFMNWRGPILTDSGGFQVYSLSKIRKVTAEGVKFQSHLSGEEFILTPKKALEIQKIIGSDIVMILDECVGYPATREAIEKAVERTTLWAKQSMTSLSDDFMIKKGNRVMKSCNHETTYFAITQGGIYKDLRLKSAHDLVGLNFNGYAIGGLAVGEPWSKAKKILEWVEPELPKDKPRYLMGVGYPEQIIDAVKRGVDMFDCVIPTREARHGRLYAWHPRVIAIRPLAEKQSRGIFVDKRFYTAINIRNSKFTSDFSPINANSKIPELREYSKAYLRHLFKIEEPLAMRLATLNNVEFYLDLMQRIRQEIKLGEL